MTGGALSFSPSSPDAFVLGMPPENFPFPNGRLPASALRRIACGGLLLRPAALAWEAMAHAARRDCVYLNVNNPSNTYRSLAMQRRIFLQRYTQTPRPGVEPVEYAGGLWYLNEGANEARPPGFSVHGLGLAVDLNNHTSRRVLTWLRKHARRFGWTWELASEPWHLIYTAGESVPEAVLAHETHRPEAQWTQKDIHGAVAGFWVPPPSAGWAANGFCASAPFLAGNMVFARSGQDGFGLPLSTLKNVFRQASGLICNNPQDFISFGLPLLVVENPRQTALDLASLARARYAGTVLAVDEAGEQSLFESILRLAQILELHGGAEKIPVSLAGDAAAHSLGVTRLSPQARFWVVSAGLWAGVPGP
jgi:hypothetical protein